LEGLTARLGQERRPDTTAVLFLLLQDALETFRRDAVQALLAVEDVEDEMFEQRRPEQIYRLARLRRRAALLHHSLLPYLQVTDELFTRRMLSRSFPEPHRAALVCDGTDRHALVQVDAVGRQAVFVHAQVAEEGRPCLAVARISTP
jgi:Mg2+ and Co2+ transporter CorA